MTALVIGTVLALSALAFVLYPLFVAPLDLRRPVSQPRAASDSALSALREVEFDRETGKLSDTDYAELKSEYTREALAAIRDEGQLLDPANDAAEAIILKYRQRRRDCPSCGPRPEADAIYCSDCGRFLSGTCGGCGASVTEAGARFCSACGKVLAA